MSYDLMVFDPAVAPRDRQRFLNWYQQQAEWQESHGYNSPEIPAAGLALWFRAIITTFPPMNGSLASNDPDDPRVTDYSLGRSVIYAAFAWSQSVDAYNCVKKLAAEHNVGFFDVSGKNGDIWWPTVGWKLFCEASGDIPLPLDLTFRETLNKLDPKENSFFVLEQDTGSYIQCAGSHAACTVELRTYDSPASYKHFVVGHANRSTEPASVTMSQGIVNTQKNEVLTSVDASELFDLFVADKKFPSNYVLRTKQL